MAKIAGPTLSAICTVFAFSTASMAVPFDCGSQGFDPQRNPDSIKYIDTGLAAVTGPGKAFFSNCPAAGCSVQSYLLPGDTVVTGEERPGWVCALFPNQRGGTFGWLPAGRLKPLPLDADPPLAVWMGKWQMHKDANIEIKTAAGRLSVHGMAFWIGSPENVHDGELSGTGTPKHGILELREPKADQYSCAATLQLIGPYLMVEDNGMCGGMNVSFTGLYRRK